MARHAEIAGAGFGGLCAALALLQRGWTVRVHEQSPSLRSEGFGIAIHANGMRVLEALGVRDGVLEQALRISRLETRDRLDRLTAVTRPRAPTYRVSRQHMVKVLGRAVTDLGGTIRTSSRAIAATTSGTLLLDDGKSVEADLVVAADGVNSAVRDSLGLLRRRIMLDDGAMRLVIPRTDADRAANPHDSAPASETWSGRRRIIYNACSADDVYLAMSCLASDCAGSRTPIDAESWKHSFPLLEDVIDRAARETDWARVMWVRFQVIHLHRWSRGRVAVLGDAANAMPPNLGQGGGCAMMNALGLAVALDERDTIEDGLDLWERRERPLTEHTQRWSRMYSATTHWPDWMRSGAFSLIARSKHLSAMIGRTASHHPTGTTAGSQISPGRALAAGRIATATTPEGGGPPALKTGDDETIAST